MVHTARIYGTEPVNVSVDELSHMARSSTEAVYMCIVNERNSSYEILDFLQILQLKWLSNQSRIAKLPVIFYLLGLCYM